MGKLNWKMSSESEMDDDFVVKNIFVVMWDGYDYDFNI